MSKPELPRALRADAALPIAWQDAALDTPAVLVDLDIVDANIRHMAEFAARQGMALRPHIKTHKSAAMAKRQLAAGAAGICCATVSEAEAMVDGGIGDILIAYPLVGTAKFERLAPLLERARITLAADSEAVIALYSNFAASLGRVVPVLLEIDTGMHRVGAAPDNALGLAKLIDNASHLDCRGIMTHAGQTHDVSALPDIAAVGRAEAAIMAGVRAALLEAGLSVAVVSAGSSITAAYFTAGDAITEIRPGTYIYNDLRTLGLSACTADAMAVTIVATVVSLMGDRVTIDAGSKTLTVTKDQVFGYGTLVEDASARFTRLSEEHGVMNIPEAESKIRVGQRVRVRPVHVCVWMDLQTEVYGVRGGQILERISVDAMRHSL